MKKNIFILGACIFLLQACGKKESQENTTAAADSTTVATEEPAPTTEVAPAIAIANSEVEGKWVHPVAGSEKEKEGFELKADGKASSINMATLIYDSWKLEGNKLTLQALSKGNGSESKFEDVYTVNKDDKGTISITSTNDATDTYSKQ
jgi:hypothetical protein